MIQLPNHIHPKQEVLDKLNSYQSSIIGTFVQKQQLVKVKFKAYNVNTNGTFGKVKEALTQMCCGAKRCAYCEDSVADEVEHIFPKDLYPDKCFDWHNYLYACGPCNGPKSNQFAIFRADTNALEHLDRTIEPPEGMPLLINPRIENAMDFCRLNFITFHFEITATEGTQEYERADYTLNTVLRLNIQREYLREARENAYGMYKVRLSYYTNNKNRISQAQIDKMIVQLQKESHPSVWKEMQRSYTQGRLQHLDNDLYELFEASPESLTW